jgi:hypothetical protein
MLQGTVSPVDRLFRALSDRTRLRVLHLLTKGEVCVGDLVAVLGFPSQRYPVIWHTYDAPGS